MGSIRNPLIENTLVVLRKASKGRKRGVWRAVLRRISERRITSVNLWKISRFTNTGDTIVVPGKVLALGDLDHSLEIGAYSYSNEARIKLSRAGCKALTIPELVENHPDGKRVKIIGG